MTVKVITGFKNIPSTSSPTTFKEIKAFAPAYRNMLRALRRGQNNIKISTKNRFENCLHFRGCLCFYRICYMTSRTVHCVNIHKCFFFLDLTTWTPSCAWFLWFVCCCLRRVIPAWEKYVSWDNSVLCLFLWCRSEVIKFLAMDLMKFSFGWSSKAELHHTYVNSELTFQCSSARTGNQNHTSEDVRFGKAWSTSHCSSMRFQVKSRH